MQLRVYIEIPKGSRAKYEYDYNKKCLVVDRYLGIEYPFNYGFIPNTLWEDGDALDAIVICPESLVAGCELNLKPIGYFEMYDNGVSDFKLVFSVGGLDLNKELEKARVFLKSYKTGVELTGFIKKEEKILEVIRKATK